MIDSSLPTSILDFKNLKRSEATKQWNLAESVYVCLCIYSRRQEL